MAPLRLLLLATLLVGSAHAVKRGRDDDGESYGAEQWAKEQKALPLNPVTNAVEFAQSVVQFATKVKAGQLSSVVGDLPPAIVRGAVRALEKALTIKDAAAPTDLTSALCKLLMQYDDVVAAQDGVAQALRPFDREYAAKLGVSIEMACRATNLAGVWGLMKDPVCTLKDASIADAKERKVTTMVEQCIFEALTDGEAYNPTTTERIILDTFIAIATAWWLPVSLTRFLHASQCCRSPVLLAKSGLAYLLERLNKALASGVTPLTVDTLYQFLRTMLRDEPSAELLLRFMDCLCFFAKLRSNLVNKLRRSDKKRACTESRGQTQAVHADTECLRIQLEFLYHRYVVDPTAFVGAFLSCKLLIWTSERTVAELEVRFSFDGWERAHTARLRVSSNCTPWSTLIYLLAEGLKGLLVSFTLNEADAATDPEMNKKLHELRSRLAAELNAEVDRNDVRDDEFSLRGALERALHRQNADSCDGSALLHGWPISFGLGQGDTALVIDLLPTRRKQSECFAARHTAYGKVHIVYRADLDMDGKFVLTKSQTGYS